jgi:serine phosphatase RsbU (regulator of sigma subunit)
MIAVFSLYSLHTIRLLVLFKRRKTTVRNLRIFLGVLVVASLLASPLVPVEGSFLLPIIVGLAVLMVVVVSFRQNWIVYLSRREKMYALTYAGLLFLASLFLAALLYQNGDLMREVEEFSRPLATFARVNAILATVYFGMTFISTLFHLPTAEAYEQKQSELTSLHNLTRLTTQVLDFDDLVRTVAQMTVEVCGADVVWLELVTRDDDGNWNSSFAAQTNISLEDVEQATNAIDPSLRSVLLDMHKIISIDDTWADRRMSGLKKLNILPGSLVSIPLLSQETVIGILHASKRMEHGFDKDDIDVLVSFGDHVTIALENARLIEKSIERERLEQELQVAQRMQKQLLPQFLPQIDEVDFAAMSESSLEVGGDYYDIVQLTESKWAIAVGDVSGKGVSAAFYMAEVKGIVLSLSKMCSSPKELLLRANQALKGSLERKAFVSLVYAVLDIRRNSLLLARAGHCPVIRAHKGGVDLLRPGGLGLGMASSSVFEGATEEQYIEMVKDDVCVLYTDGITEARNSTNEEYGYERLCAVVGSSKHLSALEIQNNILESVRTFCGQTTYNDDMTLVIIKWLAAVPDTSGSDGSNEPSRRKKKETFA